MMRKFITLTLLCLLTSVGCQTTSAFVPKANQSTYFATRSAGFLMSVAGRSVQSTYYLSLIIRKPLVQDGYIEVEFENPSDKEAPIIVGNTLKANQSIVDIRSPEVDGIKKSGVYEVVIRLYETEKKTKLLGTHKQQVGAIHSERTIQKISKK